MSSKPKEVVHSLNHPRWAVGVEQLQRNGQQQEQQEEDEFDPFRGLEGALSNNDDVVCSSCKFSIGQESDRSAIVAHYQSAWHRGNLRRIASGKNPVSEQDFEDDKEDEVSQESSDEEEEELVLSSKSRVFFLHNDIVFSIYRSILPDGVTFPTMETFVHPLDCAIFLLAGGHFAGAVFKNDRMVVHKTIQRYTVRAKQGGAQSANDGSKGAALSAGAALRRYNERTLRSEISQLIACWKEELSSAPLVFIRCASYQRATFQVDNVLEKEDVRIRNIPFETKRPSLAELSSTRQRLASVFEHGPREDFLKNLEAEWKVKKPTALQRKKKENDNLTVPEEDEEKEQPTGEKKKDHLKPVREEEPKEDLWPLVPRDLRMKLYDLIREDKAHELKAEIEGAKHVSETLRYVEERTFAPDGSTFLHMAASRGLDAVLLFLLELRCDPSVKNEEGKVPISVSLNKKTKAVFIDYRANNPTAWPNWQRTFIPEVEELTEEQKAKLQEKKKDKKQRQKERLKERKAQEKQEADENKAKEAFLNLTEREKRALAAEARLGTLARCVNCGNALPPTPFEYNSIKLCSPACVAVHRTRNL